MPVESKNEKGDRPGEPGLVFFGFKKVKAEEKEGLVRAHFDSIARKYDLMNTLLSFGIHHYWKRVAVRLAAVEEDIAILDICGGTGDLSLLAAPSLGPSGRIILCDINRAMIEAGRQKIARSHYRESISYVQGDGESLSFPHGAFDRVLVGFGIRNLVHLDQGLREMYRVLKPGGRFVCLEFSKPTSAWFRMLYDFYSFRIMPVAGRLLAGSDKAYTYLPESIRTFPDADRLSEILSEIGFIEVRYRRLTNGIAVIHVAEKGSA
jgi:demethylmenaquinone methyltransferase / 2-methoxy-6-polyprenyl-1,4-benzoquinol methylase